MKVIDSQQFRAHLRASQQVQEVEKEDFRPEASIRFAEETSPEPSRELRADQILAVTPKHGNIRYAGIVTRQGQEDISLTLPWADPGFSLVPGDRLRIEYWKEDCAYSFDAAVLSFDAAKNQLIILRPKWGALARNKNKVHRRMVRVSFTVVDARIRGILSEQVKDAEASDINLEGLTLHSPLAIGLGDKLAMVLFLSQRTRALGWVAGAARVSRYSPAPFSIPVKFAALENEDQNRLALYVAKIGNDPGLRPGLL